MKIVNETNLRYAELGLIIDNIMKSNTGSTNYYGKTEVLIIEFGSHNIRVEIRYLKRYVEWRFSEIWKVAK